MLVEKVRFYRIEMLTLETSPDFRMEFKSYFNLVFKSNTSSVKLWEKLGFEKVATLENAARLEGLERSFDTAFGYRFDLEKLPVDYLDLDSTEI
jgi:L-amino acid N-acyltransferase YncA